MRRSRRFVLSAAALGLALAATGCTYLSPVQTKDFYQAADGTNASLEQSGTMFAGVRNALLVIDGDGNAAFSATAVNYSDEELAVTLEGVVEGSAIFSTRVTVPAHGTVDLGPGEGRQPVQVSAIDVRPGSIVELEVTAGEGATAISLPVYDDSLEYLNLEPSDAG